jgi:hypothetical protein
MKQQIFRAFSALQSDVSSAKSAAGATVVAIK